MIRFRPKKLRNRDYNIEEVVLRKGRHKKKVKRCNDIFTFDIETTSAFRTPSGEIIPYSPGKSEDYWNSLEKLALCYIWQFSVNDEVYYGRDLKDFKKCLKALPKDTEILIWVHNLSFEFMFLQGILHMDDVFARSPHKPMKSRSKEFPDIEFRCSYTLTNLSLEKWGKELGVLKKVGDLDYLKLRTPLTELTETELGYCEQDCIVVYAGIKDHLKRYNTVWDIPLTSTGKVRAPIKALVTADKDYMYQMKKLVPRDADEYRRFQQIFSGGYTHASRKYINKIVKTGADHTHSDPEYFYSDSDKIYHVDIASSYPFSLCAYRYPYSGWYYMGRRLPDKKTFEYRAYIIKLHFKGLRSVSWNTYIQASKCTGHNLIYDNGRIIAADELRIMVTEQDYITIMNNYKWESIESEGTYVCHKQYLPAIFIDFILDLYKDKTELKGVDPDRYAIAKQYINAMFGCQVTSICQSDVEFNQEDPEQWYIGDLTAEKVNEKLDKLRRWFDKSYFLSYAVGCWCTAYSRRRLWRCFELVQDGKVMDNDLLYADTDSLFHLHKYSFEWFNNDASARLSDMCKARNIDFSKTRPKDIHGKEHPLGVMEEEDPSDSFRTLGSKKYLEEIDGKLFMTVAGVNKSAVNSLNSMEEFQDGYKFDKDDPNVHKLEHTYLVDMPVVTYPDGYVSTFKYGINMRPTGYTLSTPNIIRDFFELMDGKVTISQNYDIKLRGVF